YAYSLCQIPLGILIDCVGVRKTAITSMILCISGAFLLSFAPTLGALQLSRVLVGMGSACAFICALKIIIDHLPVGNRGFLMGATLTLGTVGALIAGKPLALLADTVGWRQSISDVAFLGLFILSIAVLVLPKAKKESLIPISIEMPAKIGRSLIQVLTSRSVMMYAILAISIYTPLSVLADLWGVAFLMQKYGLVRAEAAKISMMVYLGLGLGSLVLPWLSEKYHVLNGSIRLGIIGVLIVFALLLYGPVISPAFLMVLLTLLGIFCGAEMLCFTGAGQHTTIHNVGTTLGVVNTLNMLGGGLLQQAIGYGLDKLWDGKTDSFGVRLYSTAEYTQALSVLMIIVVICCLLSFKLPKDKVVDYERT
ncbi:MAG: MFS transporter, partial [Gammaproteobacteria bacterium]